MLCHILYNMQPNVEIMQVHKTGPFFQHVMTVGRGLDTVKDGPGKVEEERDICMMFLCGLGTWLLANMVTRNVATGSEGTGKRGYWKRRLQ